MSRPAAKAAPLAPKWRELAEARCTELGERLTPARLAVYAELLACDRPLSAYELIALLEQRQQRKIAPLTVYRHLGLPHANRRSSTGFNPRNPTCPATIPYHPHDSQFLLCSSCGHVDEVESKGIETMLSEIADERGFRPDHTVVEIKGVCGTCADSDPH